MPLTDELSKYQVVNEKIAARYSDPETQQKHELYQNKMEQIFIETLENESEVVAQMDEELKRLGFDLENSVTLEPGEFLDFIKTNKTPKLSKISEQATTSDVKVLDNFTVLRNESDANETPMYVILGAYDLAFFSYLAQRGIDITHASEDVQQELLSGKALSMYNQLVKTLYQGSEKAKKVIVDERVAYATDLKKEFGSFNPDEPDFERLKEVLELYEHIPARFGNEDLSLIPEFELLISNKKYLSSENVSTLNYFLEENEKLIFTVLGEEYFFKINSKHVDYESAYQEMFGYTHTEIWERRNRNWANVNKYLMEEIKPRGELEVADLRNIHVLSTKGVLPFFCQGFRNDRIDGFHRANYSKKDVTFGSENNRTQSTDLEDLDETLQMLTDKANSLVKSKLPPIMKEVAMGNLFSEYASTHPHPDGNGTNAIFFVEAMKVLEGNYEPPKTYDPNYYKRVAKSLNGNVLAMGVGYVRLVGYELSHRSKTDTEKE
jgi:hypothetical protein